MNRIKTYLNSLGKATRTVILALAVIFVSAGIAQAATTITTDISTGALTLTGALTGTSATLSTTLVVTATTTTNGLTVSNAATLASTTATSFKVGQVGTQLSQVVAGYCVTGSVTFTAVNIASSTQTYANCTPYTAAGVAITSLTAVTSRVFMQATSSLPYYVVLQAASSTASNVINVALTNTSTSTLPTAGIYTFNFFAVQ